MDHISAIAKYNRNETLADVEILSIGDFVNLRLKRLNLPELNNYDSLACDIAFMESLKSHPRRLFPGYGNLIHGEMLSIQRGADAVSLLRMGVAKNCGLAVELDDEISVDKLVSFAVNYASCLARLR